MLVEAEVKVDPGVTEDPPSDVEPEVRDDSHDLMLVETAPPLDQRGEGDLSVVGPISKRKMVPMMKGE